MVNLRERAQMAIKRAREEAQQDRVARSLAKQKSRALRRQSRLQEIEEINKIRSEERLAIAKARSKQRIKQRTTPRTASQNNAFSITGDFLGGPRPQPQQVAVAPKRKKKKGKVRTRTIVKTVQAPQPRGFDILGF